MNIFVLDLDPHIAAQYHCDKHMKMIVESAQLLCTAHRVLGDIVDPQLYKITHVNHPCARWARESSGNYIWLYKLFIALCHEYTKRYGRVHKTEGLRSCLAELPKNISHGLKTPHPQTMPEQYRNVDPVLAYRNFYINEKAGFAQWRTGDIPDWFIIMH